MPIYFKDYKNIIFHLKFKILLSFRLPTEPQLKSSAPCQKLERYSNKIKGLDCRDQSRSSLRFLDLSGSTFDFLDVERQVFSNVKIKSLDQDLNKNQDFRVIETVKTRFMKCQDFLDTSRQAF
jgi:hypothetical protein